MNEEPDTNEKEEEEDLFCQAWVGDRLIRLIWGEPKK